MSIKNQIRAEIERRKNICEGVFERDSDTYYQGKAVAYQETLSFLDSIPEQERSEEDIKKIRSEEYTKGFNDAAFGGKLKEWSEEDKDMLNSCISSIEEAKENRYAYKETDGDTSYDHEIAWLKSLRPSWKPSKEQMEALDMAQGEMCQTEYNDALCSLIDNLQKL